VTGRQRPEVILLSIRGSFFIREEYEERHDANGSAAHCKVAPKEMGGFGH
jgi:hypothetical protein